MVHAKILSISEYKSGTGYTVTATTGGGRKVKLLSRNYRDGVVINTRTNPSPLFDPNCPVIAPDLGEIKVGDELLFTSLQVTYIDGDSFTKAQENFWITAIDWESVVERNLEKTIEMRRERGITW